MSDNFSLIQFFDSKFNECDSHLTKFYAVDSLLWNMDQNFADYDIKQTKKTENVNTLLPGYVIIESFRLKMNR